MKKKTRVLLEITWDDELDEHPSTWDIEHAVRRDDFTYKGEQTRVVSFEDVDDHASE